MCSLQSIWHKQNIERRTKVHHLVSLQGEWKLFSGGQVGYIWQTSHTLFLRDGNDFQWLGFMSGIIIWGFKNNFNQYYKWTTIQNTFSELQCSKYFFDITIVVHQTFLTELDASNKHITIYFCNDQSMWNGVNGLGIMQAAVCQFI